MELIKLSEVKDIETKNIKMFLYGDSFIGKTTFAATFPKPLIISTDGNVKGLAKFNKDAQAVILPDFEMRETDSGMQIEESGWTLFKNFVNNVVDVPNEQIETIVVDIVKDVYDMCRKYINKKIGLVHESAEKKRGRVWGMLDDEFLPVLRKLMNCNKNVILITHEKNREGIIGPSTIDSLTTKIASYVDINSRMILEKSMDGSAKNRVLYTASKVSQAGGNRLGLTSPIEDPTYDKLVNAIKDTNKIKGD